MDVWLDFITVDIDTAYAHIQYIVLHVGFDDKSHLYPWCCGHLMNPGFIDKNELRTQSEMINLCDPDLDWNDRSIPEYREIKN